MRKFYVAYGSNLSVEQMEFRCPNAEIVGVGRIKGWELAFGQHATIIPSKGSEVPALVWSVTDEDEKKLDKYEGFPIYYYKAEVPVEISSMGQTVDVDAMVYIMTAKQKYGKPSQRYVDVIWRGYDRFGFDHKYILDALLKLNPTKKSHSPGLKG